MMMIIVPAAKNPADSGWIKKTEEVKQEQPKPQPVKQPEPVKAPVEQPKPLGANPFQKSANGEIVSTRKVEEAKVEPPAKV